jgi:guanylate kinase
LPRPEQSRRRPAEPSASVPNAAKRGVLLVLAGTSGAGKGTVGARLRATDPDLHWSVSWTTRPRRPNEVAGVDYYYVSRDAFERLRDEGGFLEWFEVYGDLKGTPRQFVVDELAAGRDVMLEVDVQGALAVQRALPEALLVFVKAPSRAEQRRRLEARAELTGESPESIARRLGHAEEEERIAETRFDRVVVNDDVDRAVAEIAGILADRRTAGRNPRGA